MGYTFMDGAARARFLAADGRPGVLATVRPDGSAHGAPVWFVVDDDGSLLFMTGSDTVKGRNLARTGRAALVVDDDRPPFSFVSVEGPVEPVSVGPDELLAWSTRIAARYMGPDLASAYGRRNAVEGEQLWRLRPERAVGAVDVADGSDQDTGAQGGG